MYLFYSTKPCFCKIFARPIHYRLFYYKTLSSLRDFFPHISFHAPFIVHYFSPPRTQSSPRVQELPFSFVFLVPLVVKINEISPLLVNFHNPSPPIPLNPPGINFLKALCSPCRWGEIFSRYPPNSTCIIKTIRPGPCFIYKTSLNIPG
jgi:hypothetical protein